MALGGSARDRGREAVFAIEEGGEEAAIEVRDEGGGKDEVVEAGEGGGALMVGKKSSSDSSSLLASLFPRASSGFRQGVAGRESMLLVQTSSLVKRESSSMLQRCDYT